MTERNLSTVFRVAGAALLLISGSTFLLSSWPEQNDLFRYGVLFAHVLALFVGALFVGRRLGETKTARVLLWTASAFVPVQLAALGGLIYSRFALDPAELDLPQIATWIAPSPWSACAAGILTMPLLYVVARATARVLAPSLAKIWTGVFVTQSLLFLVPLRESGLAGVIALLGCVAPLLMEQRVCQRTEASKTIEGRLLRALMWAAPVMIASRTVLFYSPSGVFFGLMLLAAGALGLLVVAPVVEGEKPSAAIELFSGYLAAAGATWSGLALWGESWAELSFLLPVAVTYGASHLADEASTALRGTSSIVMLVAGTLLVSLSGSALNVLLVSAVFATFLAEQWLARSPRGVALHSVGCLASVVGMFRVLIGFEGVVLWQLLSALGAAAFVAATLLEKYRGRLRAFFASSAP